MHQHWIHAHALLPAKGQAVQHQHAAVLCEDRRGSTGACARLHHSGVELAQEVCVPAEGGAAGAGRHQQLGEVATDGPPLPSAQPLPRRAEGSIQGLHAATTAQLMSARWAAAQQASRAKGAGGDGKTAHACMQPAAFHLQQGFKKSSLTENAGMRHRRGLPCLQDVGAGLRAL